MRSIRIKFIFTCLFVAVFSQAISLPISIINGPDTVTPGSTQGYYYNAPSVISSPSWEVTGGTISYTNVDGDTQYSVTIHWGSAGTGTVVLKSGSTTLATKNVSISASSSDFMGGGGSYCTGQTANVYVYNSVSNRVYQLYRDNSSVMSAQRGNGGTIYWSVTVSGEYTCTGAGATVSGSASVVIDPGPTVYYIVGGPDYCGGSRTITLSDSDLGPAGSSYFLRRNGAIVGSSVGGNGHDLSWTGITTPGTYTVTAQSGDGCPSTMDGSRVINPIPSAPPSILTQDRCGPGDVPFTATAGANGNTLKWYSADTGGELLTSVPSLSYTPSPTLTTTYYASTYNSTTGCESETRTSAIATIKAVPEVAITNWANVYSGESINVTISDTKAVPGTTFAWTYSGVYTTGGSNGSGATISQVLTRDSTELPAIATYTITPTGGNGCIGTSLVKTLNVVSEMDSLNYIITYTTLTDEITNPEDVTTFPVNSVNHTTQYFDGLGRPNQNVTWQGSRTKKDLVQPVSYDSYGRETHKYLPFVQGTRGYYRRDFIAKEKDSYSSQTNPQFQFYQETSTVPVDTVPYSTTVFEASPLNRPLAAYSPGQKWAEQDKKITYSYPINIHGTGTSGSQESIIVWKVDPSTSSLARDTVGYYSTGSLMIKSVKDEHGNEVREYTNKEGQVILKKVYVTGSTSDFNTLGNWAETYYVYDDLGNLSFVLPPEAVARIIQND